MATYKIVKMNTTEGIRYMLYRWNGIDWFPSYPYGYYKTIKGAKKAIEKRMKL